MRIYKYGDIVKLFDLDLKYEVKEFFIFSSTAVLLCGVELSLLPSFDKARLLYLRGEETIKKNEPIRKKLDLVKDGVEKLLKTKKLTSRAFFDIKMAVIISKGGQNAYKEYTSERVARDVKVR